MTGRNIVSVRLLPRGGDDDFFGPRAGNSWFSQGLIKPGKPIAAVNLPGEQWSYLPEVARTMVALLARRDRLEPFAPFHMAGHWDADGTQMAAAIQRSAVRHDAAIPKLSAFPWWSIRLASPSVITLRELLEMRYVWREPVRMCNARLVAALGKEPHTVLDSIVDATLMGVGCVSAGFQLASKAC